MVNRKGQVTIFIIVAVLIVLAIGLFFFIRGDVFSTNIPLTLSPVYDSFLNCINENTLLGADILGTQAGYIETPEFEAGSAYMPFSSQLDFYGNAVPYWYYVSGNNIEKEQVPSVNSMEDDLEQFLEERMGECNLERYRGEGVSIVLGEPSARVNIQDEIIEVSLDMDLSLEKGEDGVSFSNHNRQIDSDLGKLYDIALDIYDHEQETLFLENYGIDTLRGYAPVDGVEFSCGPEVWVGLEVSETLKDAIEANTLALKVDGDYYDLTQDENEYFVVPVSVPSDVRVNFLNSQFWPYGFEVAPTEGDVLIANPVGNQEGLGALGFCYVPYHFVYNIKYSVLVQVMDESGSGEIFQFPVAVVIQGNQPREPLVGQAIDLENDQLCQYPNKEVNVRVVNSDLQPIESRVSFSCLGASCGIGVTENGRLDALFPTCVNGFVVAQAEGYETARHQISTNSESTANIVLNKLYDVNLDVLLNNRPTSERAVITFENENGARTVLYPEQTTIQLSEGLYDIDVKVYDDSSLTIGATTREQCYEVPRGALGGVLGLTKEECVEVEFPETQVSQVLVGGGSLEYFVLESELVDYTTIEINAESIIKPESLEAVQTSYAILDTRDLGVRFKR